LKAIESNEGVSGPFGRLAAVKVEDDAPLISGVNRRSFD
jgi:hypothetical protein